MEVWLDKQGQVPDRPPTPEQEWGSELEDVIARRYARETGRLVWNPERLYRHPDHDMLLATPDRLASLPQGVTPLPDRGLEVKTAGLHASKEWGEPGTDQVPQHYLLQCAHYMAVTGMDRWDLAVLIGGSDFRIYTLQRDRDLEQHVIERLVSWWKQHVTMGVEPEMDGSRGVREWLQRRYPRESDAPPLVADEATEIVAAALAQVRAAADMAEDKRAELENVLKSVMGDHARLEGQGWGVSWKATKPRVTVDWQAVAKSYRSMLELTAGLGGMEERDAAIRECDKVLERNTTEAAAVRRFVFTITTARRELTS